MREQPATPNVRTDGGRLPHPLSLRHYAMNRRTCFSLIAFAFLTASANAVEPSLTEAGKKLDQAMEREISGPKKEDGKTTERGELRNQRQMSAAQARIRRALEDPSRNDALEFALSEAAPLFRSEEVSRELENVRTAARKEREAKETAVLEQVNDLTKRAANAVRTAKEPSDIDAILRGLDQIATQSNDHRSETIRAAISKLHPIRQFLLRWQDYLFFKKSGDIKRAVEVLRSAANSPGDAADLLPRSELLALIERNTAKSDPGNEGVDEILAKIKTLPDMAGGIKQLRLLESRRLSMTDQSYGSDGIYSTLNALVALEKAYREFEAGLPTSLEAAMNPPDFRAVDMVQLRVQLLLLMLPRFIGTPPELKPQAGETTQAFVEKVITLARDRGDWAMMVRARDAKRILSRGNQFFTNAGLLAFIAGLNQEAAGQYMLAVISYQNALKNGTDDISPKLIGEKLEAIKAAHPAEYEQGVAAVVGPATRPPYNYRDQQSTPAPTPNSDLAVPGGSPTATSSPSASAKPSSSPRATAKPR
jgi:hypothetical protein